MHKSLPETGYVRLWQIIGRKPTPDYLKGSTKNPKDAVPAIIPVSKSHWWDGVRKGIYPQPVHLGPRVTVWRVEDIIALIEKGGDAKMR